MKTFVTILFSIFLSAPLSAQYSKEISITSENDNYLFHFHDGYYTNGLYLGYRSVSRHKPGRVLKEIMKLEIGQMIFNPSSYKATDYSQMDRPFAGYLYASISRTRFSSENNLLSLGVELGTIGKASGAEAVQKNYHRLIGIYKVPGWSAQLRDEPGINFNLIAVQLHANDQENLPAIDISTIEKFKIGNSFTNASVAIMLRLGRKERTIETNSWSSRIERDRPHPSQRPEIFAFLQPELMYQLYNATVQGGMFIREKGPVTGEIMPWVYQQRLGAHFANKSFSVQLAVVFKTKEAKAMRKHERFGVITLAHRFN